METGTTADPPFADQARAGGTDGRAMPSLEAVERRRSELLATVFLALAGLAVALVLLSPHGRPPGRLFNMAAFRVGLVGVTAALCMYVVDKERHLRRNPKIALTVVDPQDAYKWVSVSGDAELTTDGADPQIDKLAKKYLGKDEYPWRNPEEQRIKVRITPQKVDASGLGD